MAPPHWRAARAAGLPKRRVSKDGQVSAPDDPIEAATGALFDFVKNTDLADLRAERRAEEQEAGERRSTLLRTKSQTSGIR